MREILVGLVLAALAFAPANAGSVGADCALKGIKLLGNVKVVDSFPNLKVEIVQSFPDLRV